MPEFPVSLGVPMTKCHDPRELFAPMLPASELPGNYLTVITLALEDDRIFSAVLPKKIPAKPVRPTFPMAIKSAPSFVA